MDGPIDHKIEVNIAFEIVVGVVGREPFALDVEGMEAETDLTHHNSTYLSPTLTVASPPCEPWAACQSFRNCTMPVSVSG